MPQLVLNVYLRRLLVLVGKNNRGVSFKFVDVVQHLCCRLVSLVCILLHGAHHDFLQPFRDVGVD